MSGANKQLRRQSFSGGVSAGCPCPHSSPWNVRAPLRRQTDVSSMHGQEGLHTGLPVSWREQLRTSLTSAAAKTIMVCPSYMLLV